MGFSRQESWSGLLFSTLGDLLNSGIELTSLVSHALVGGFLPLHHLYYSFKTHEFPDGFLKHINKFNCFRDNYKKRSMQIKYRKWLFFTKVFVNEKCPA